MTKNLQISLTIDTVAPAPGQGASCGPQRRETGSMVAPGIDPPVPAAA
jgi:hypothetical protein